jgi:hypothetical protein
MITEDLFIGCIGIILMLGSVILPLFLFVVLPLSLLWIDEQRVQQYLLRNIDNEQNCSPRRNSYSSRS